MKKVFKPLFSCIALLWSTVVVSQITITAADFAFQTQDTILVHTADPTNLTPPVGGINQSWDYSGLTSLSSHLIGIQPDVSTSLAAPLFPGANIYFGDLLELQENFYSMNNQRFEILGSWITAFPIPNQTATIYSIPLTLYEFPIAYGNTFFDNAVASQNHPSNYGIISSIINQSIYSEVIGWGDLATPSNYYPDVLLQMNIINTEISNGTGGYGGTPPNTTSSTDTTYNFLAKNTYYPLLTLRFTHYNTAFSPPPSNYQKAVEYLFGVVYVDLDEISDLNSGDLSVFPNPASDVIRIMGTERDVNYNIVAINGAVLQSGMLRANEHTINITNLPSGNYLLLVEEKDTQSALKFVKQ